MSSLETELQRVFLWEYFALPRQEMLLRFLEFHDELYQQRLDDRKELMRRLGQEDPQTDESGYPVKPVVYSEACEELATLEGFTFRALAVCRYSNSRILEYYKTQSEKSLQLCGEYDEVSMTLRQAHIDLIEKFNKQTEDFVELFNGTRLGNWQN